MNSKKGWENREDLLKNLLKVKNIAWEESLKDFFSPKNIKFAIEKGIFSAGDEILEFITLAIANRIIRINKVAEIISSKHPEIAKVVFKTVYFYVSHQLNGTNERIRSLLGPDNELIPLGIQFGISLFRALITQERDYEKNFWGGVDIQFWRNLILNIVIQIFLGTTLPEQRNPF